MRLLFILSLLFSYSSLQAQNVGSLKDVQPDTEDFENVHVKKVYTDQHVSAFVIWVRKGVKSHYHAKHTENLVVISGAGKMTIGETEYEIGAGDYIHIPEGSVHSVVVTSDDPLKVLSFQSPEFLGQDRIFVD